MLKLSLPLLLAVLLAFAGCLRKSVSMDEGTSLYVIADSTSWLALETTLRCTFERTIQTPRKESVFAVHWVRPKEFNQYATRKHLAIIGLLDSDAEISSKVKGMLSAAVRERVVDGSAFVFPKEEPWAKGQLLLVLAANSVETLAEKLTENKDYLYGLLEKRLRDATRKEMFERYEQTEISQEVLEKYGWTIRVQHDYFVKIDRADANFFMLRRSLPGRERWLFVHWVENASPEDLTPDWVMARRNMMTKRFYEGDFIYLQDAKNPYGGSSITTIAGREALRIEGLWVNEENKADATGGPFRTYAFFDEDTRRIYLLDLAVWFPGGNKEPMLRQLDIMAASFRTAADIEREKKEAS